VKQDATAGVTIGGAQDSGVLMVPPSPPAPPLPAGAQPWSGTSDDGIDVAFEKAPTATDVAYRIRNDTFQKSTDSGVSWPIDFTANLPGSQVSIFVNRFAVDPNNGGYLYVGGSGGQPGTPVPGDVLQSRDGATSFRPLGVNAPGLLLECATLTSSADRDRLKKPQGLSELASAIAAGVETWQRNE